MKLSEKIAAVESGEYSATWTTPAGSTMKAVDYPIFVRISTRPVKREPDGAATMVAFRFWPARIEQGVSSLTLRRTRSQLIHAGAAFADQQPGISSEA